MALVTRPDGLLRYVTGSMGSGKTSWCKGELRSAPRLLCWDGKGVDWGPRDGCRVIDLGGLRRIVTDKRLCRAKLRLSVRVEVSRKNFERFAALAWIWARIEPGALMVDEIGDVTTVGKAPGAWGEIVRKGRAFGLNTYVTTQRPQECDKTAQGNAMIFHCGLMADAEDQAYVARRLLGGMVSTADVAALGPMEYIERDVRTRTIKRGRTAIPKPRAVRALPAPAAASGAPTRPQPAPMATESVAPRGLLDW